MIFYIFIVIKNIKEFSKSGTKVVVHTLNGHLVNDRLKDRKKYIVKRDKEAVFYLEKMYDDKDKFKKINVFL